MVLCKAGPYSVFQTSEVLRVLPFYFLIFCTPVELDLKAFFDKPVDVLFRNYTVHNNFYFFMPLTEKII